MEMHLGMTSSEVNNTGLRGTNEGSKLAGNESLWTDGSLDINADFGISNFAGLPGGIRWASDGSFIDFSESTSYWSSSIDGDYNAWYRTFWHTSPKVIRDKTSHTYGFSVRCIRD
jgi:uncharacterized protein (TIGR02145 family)